MKIKYFLIMILAFTCLNIGFVQAKDNSADEFYNSLSKNEHPYKEYKNATLNIREKVNGSNLDEIQKKLGKYALDSLPTDYKGKELYFFASVYEDNHVIVEKSIFYDMKGDFLEGNFSRLAKKDAVLKGEFKGWSEQAGTDEFFNENPR